MANTLKEGAKGTASDVYMLQTGNGGLARLRLVDRVYGEGTRRLLHESGLGPGCHVLDLACGIGAVSCWIASEVGSNGRVVAADVNPDQLVTARGRCARCSHGPIEYIETSAYDTSFPDATFDIVHIRLLLCHLTEPERALAEACRILKPGGALVCQELFVQSLWSNPRLEALERWKPLALEVGKYLGVDYNFGLRLPAAAKRAGFRNIEVRMNHPAQMRGEEKHLWAYTFAEALPVIVNLGKITLEEAEPLLAQAHEFLLSEETLLVHACLPGIIARK